MTSKIVVNNIEADAGISTVTFASNISAPTFVGNLNTTSGVITARTITGVSTAGITTAYIGSINDGPISGARNRIINGDMRVDQRNSGVSTTVSTTSVGAYTLDRWNAASAPSLGAATVIRSGTAPVGFTSSLLWTTTTASGTLTGSQFACVNQVIEGYNTSDLSWGTANAKSVTLSFWVRCSLTGTFSGSIRNFAGTRGYIFTYTINTQNTFEYKTITIPGDTAGTWTIDNTGSIQLSFSLGTGPNYSTTAGSWQAGNLLATTGETQVINNLNATWYLTGVQLEAGTVATPFERRSYGQELALCQRYYYRDTYTVVSNVEHFLFYGSMYGTTQLEGVYSFPVEMRSAPTLGNSALSTFKLRNGAETPTSLAIYGANTRSGLIYTSNTATGTQKQANALMSISTNGTVTYLEFNAEL